MADVEIREIDSSEVEEAAHLLTFLNPDTPPAVLSNRLGTILDDHPHYRAIGAFQAGALVGLAGAWLATKIWCGRYLEVDNLVVHPSQRGSGIGSLLIERLEALALDESCNIVVLDSYTANHPSHRLYHRHGFEIWGFHFVKPVGDWKGDGQS